MSSKQVTSNERLCCDQTVEPDIRIRSPHWFQLVAFKTFLMGEMQNDDVDIFTQF